jgi:hypothetical protein
MRSVSARLGMLGLGFALMFFSASSAAEATTITSVVVTIGGVTYSPGSVGWTFPVTLSSGQDLVLTQNFPGVANGTSSYNFDTSDDPNVVDPLLLPIITITADGVTTTFTDTKQVLNVSAEGSVGFDLNEAQLFGSALTGPAGLGYQVFLGYADNVHPGTCGAYATTLGLLGSPTCFPTPFSAATVFQGKGAIVPIDPATGMLVPEPNDGVHCTTAAATCYDAGVIRIVGTSSQVPEPATMTLLLTGFGGLTARRYLRSRAK